MYGNLQEDKRQASAALAAAAAMQKLMAEEEQAAAKVAAKKAKKDRQKAKKQQAKQTLDTPALSEPAEEPFVDPSVSAPLSLAHAALQPNTVAADISRADNKLAETYVDQDKIPAVHASQAHAADRGTCEKKQRATTPTAGCSQNAAAEQGTGSCSQSQQATFETASSPQSKGAQPCSLSGHRQDASAAAAAGVVDCTSSDMAPVQNTLSAQQPVSYSANLQQPETVVEESLQQLLSCPITKVLPFPPTARMGNAMMA